MYKAEDDYHMYHPVTKKEIVSPLKRLPKHTDLIKENMESSL